MTEPSSLAPVLKPDDAIQFVASHRPNLEDGEYTLKVTQRVELHPSVDETYSSEATFWVLGPQFTLDPQVIRAVFPPPGSQGAFWNVFPHVILNRSTLPWERTACKSISDPNQRPPWLALLLFDEKEAPKLLSSSIRELVSHRSDRSWPWVVPDDPGQHDDDAVQLIDVPWSVLQPLIPAGLDDFSLRTHVRVVSRHSAGRGGMLPQDVVRDDIDSERAVLIGNRLPKPGSRNVVHLVSLEDRYDSMTNGGSGFGGAAAGSSIRLVSLRHWDFFCLDEKKTFKGLLETLNKRQTALGLVEESSLFHLPHDQIDAAAGGIVNGTMTRPATPVDARTILDSGTITAGLVDDGKDRAGRPLPPLLLAAYAPAGVRLDSGSIVSGKIQGAKDAAGNALDGTTISGSLFDAGRSAARAWLKSGFTPLPHKFRQGDRSVSWYHGPLVPREILGPKTDKAAVPAETPSGDGLFQIIWAAVRSALAYVRDLIDFLRPPDSTREVALDPVDAQNGGQGPVLSLPAHSADALALYDETWGLFDISYAAAWELGRLLTLQNGRVALELFNWKRRHANVLRNARHLADYGYGLPVHSSVAGNTADLPDVVARWLNELTLLQHVPFNYLVPDDRLLPPESLRFFTLDRMWLECLRDGAFSVGRVLEGDRQRDAGHLSRQPSIPTLSGLLIRSEVVSGWPDLHVEAYKSVPAAREAPADASARLTLVRSERLSPNVLLCLFDGALAMADVHLTPEVLHFGLDTPEQPDEDDPTCLVKNVRNPDGTEAPGLTAGKNPQWIEKGSRLVNFPVLAARIAAALDRPSESPADFAMQMVAGVDLVRFIR